KRTAHGTYGECAAASKKEKRPPNFIAAKDRGFPRLDSAIYGRAIGGEIGAVYRVRGPRWERACGPTGSDLRADKNRRTFQLFTHRRTMCRSGSLFRLGL